MKAWDIQYTERLAAFGANYVSKAGQLDECRENKRRADSESCAASNRLNAAQKDYDLAKIAVAKLVDVGIEGLQRIEGEERRSPITPSEFLKEVGKL